MRFKNIGLSHVGKQRPKLVSAENKINRYHLINPVLYKKPISVPKIKTRTLLSEKMIPQVQTGCDMNSV